MASYRVMAERKRLLVHETALQFRSRASVSDLAKCQIGKGAYTKSRYNINAELFTAFEIIQLLPSIVTLFSKCKTTSYTQSV